MKSMVTHPGTLMVTHLGTSMVTHQGTSKLLHFMITEECRYPRLIHDELLGPIILMSCLYNMFYNRPSLAPEFILKWQPTSARAADIVQT
jgi:hypothetical protein